MIRLHSNEDLLTLPVATSSSLETIRARVHRLAEGLAVRDIKIDSVAFSGNRPKGLVPTGLDAYTPDTWMRLCDEVAHLIAGIADAAGKPLTVMTGGAQGVDQLAFWAAARAHRDLGVALENVVYVPFGSQPARWHGHGLFGRDQYARMLGTADRIVRCSRIEPAGFREAAHMLKQRNHRMVDDSAVQVFVMREDEDACALEGGTGECLRYARVAKEHPALIVAKTRAGEDGLRMALAE